MQMWSQNFDFYFSLILWFFFSKFQLISDLTWSEICLYLTRWLHYLEIQTFPTNFLTISLVDFVISIFWLFSLIILDFFPLIISTISKFWFFLTSVFDYLNSWLCLINILTFNLTISVIFHHNFSFFTLTNSTFILTFWLSTSIFYLLISWLCCFKILTIYLKILAFSPHNFSFFSS